MDGINQMKAVQRRGSASLLELRVFADEPTVTCRAQKALFAANLRYLALSLKPAMWMALPMGLLLIHLESFCGRAPLPLDREAVVTNGDGAFLEPAIARASTSRAGGGGSGGSAGARDRRERGKLADPSQERILGELRVVDGQPVVKSIEASALRRYVHWQECSLGARSHLTSGPGACVWAQVEWIEIPYPDATLTIFGYVPGDGRSEVCGRGVHRPYRRGFPAKWKTSSRLPRRGRAESRRRSDRQP
jgi:hypothetical protein